LRIAVDGMGGDHAPEEIVKGAAQAASDLGLDITVVGTPSRLEPLLDSYRILQLAPSSEEIGMDEHPAQAVRRKRDASMVVCARLCREGKVAGWVSAGNSGAIMAAALLQQGRIRGVERPALGSVIPTAGRPSYFLDVGANVDSRPEYLVQFAKMAAVYARDVMGRSTPKVGLLANGEEESKGDSLVREAHQRLRRDSAGFEFIGNVEPQELVKGTADVIVADGFVGNVAIKMAEASIDMLLGVMREEIPRSLSGKLGGLLIRPGIQRIRGKLDWREFGGAPLLGIDGVAVVAHGRSDARAMRNAVRVAAQAAEAGLVEKIREAVGR
jgi:glycerol-3-phosphate acyltransferase PlsX